MDNRRNLYWTTQSNLTLRMNINTIGIHDSVADIFPPERLVDKIVRGDVTASVVDDDSLFDCDAVVTLAYTDEFLAADVGWIHSIQSGIDRFPLSDLFKNDIVLTNSIGIHRDCVSDACVGYVVGLARGLDVFIHNQTDRHWERPAWDQTFTVAGETACVVGLGTLGCGIAERLNTLGMHVTGVRRQPDPVDHVDQVFTSSELPKAIAEARFVVLAVPLTEATTQLVDADLLASMANDSFLVNVSRGGVVDQTALIEAIQTGDIAGAALDVFETEPLPKDSPLWDLERVIVTPHSAGLYREYHSDVANIVRENLDRIRDGDPLLNCVQ